MGGLVDRFNNTKDADSLRMLCWLQTQTRAQSIVNELFPPGVPASVDPGALLDALVTRLSQEMIDDYPASDPRWAESLPPGHPLVILPISTSSWRRKKRASYLSQF